MISNVIKICKMSKKTWKSKFFRKSREIGGRKTFRFLYSEEFRVETKVFGEVMNFSTRNVRGGTPPLPVTGEITGEISQSRILYR